MALYLQKFAPTSSTSGGRSVGIVLSRTKATEFIIIVVVVGYGLKLHKGTTKSVDFYQLTE
jgi:hypothetical protein